MWREHLAMVLPLRTVNRFGQYPGGFVVRVRCNRCKLERAISSQFFVNLFGEHAAPTTIVPRLRCSKCAARDPETAIDGLPR